MGGGIPGGCITLLKGNYYFHETGIQVSGAYITLRGEADGSVIIWPKYSSTTDFVINFTSMEGVIENIHIIDQGIGTDSFRRRILHSTAVGGTIRNNFFQGNYFEISGYTTEVYNNTFIGGASGVSMISLSEAVAFRFNAVESNSVIYANANGSNRILTIEGNRLQNTAISVVGYTFMTIQNNFIAHSEFTPIAVDKHDDSDSQLLILNNLISSGSNTNDMCISFTEEARNVIIKGNRFRGHSTFTGSPYGMIHCYDNNVGSNSTLYNIRILDNKFEYGGTGIKFKNIGGTKELQISGNYFESLSEAMNLFYLDRAIISNNYIDNNGKGIVIPKISEIYQQSDTVSITNNLIHLTSTPISIFNARNINISSNTIYISGSRAGIDIVDYCTLGLIANNLLTVGYARPDKTITLGSNVGEFLVVGNLLSGKDVVDNGYNNTITANKV